jgi:hypothetical protein
MRVLIGYRVFYIVAMDRDENGLVHVVHVRIYRPEYREYFS